MQATTAERQCQAATPAGRRRWRKTTTTTTTTTLVYYLHLPPGCTYGLDPVMQASATAKGKGNATQEDATPAADASEAPTQPYARADKGGPEGPGEAAAGEAAAAPTNKPTGAKQDKSRLPPTGLSWEGLPAHSDEGGAYFTGKRNSPPTLAELGEVSEARAAARARVHKQTHAHTHTRARRRA